MNDSSLQAPCRRVRMWMALVLVLCVSASAASRAETQYVIPQEQVGAYVFIPHIARLHAGWHESLPATLAADEKIGQFLEPLIAPIHEIVQQIEQRAQKPLTAIVDLFSGECAVFLLTQNSTETKRGKERNKTRPIPFLLIVECRESPTRVQEFLSSISTPVQGNSSLKTVARVGDIPIHELQFTWTKEVGIPEIRPSKKRPTTTDSSSKVKLLEESVVRLEYAFVRNRLFLTSGAPDALREALVRSKQRRPLSLVLPISPLISVDDLPTSYALLASIYPRNALRAGLWGDASMSDALSSAPLYVSDIAQCIFTVNFDRKTVLADAFIAAQTPTRGIASTLFANRHTNLRSLHLIPSNATSFYASSLDLSRCWELTTSTARILMPKYHALATQVSRTLSGYAAMNIERDVLLNFGSELAYFSLGGGQSDTTTSSQTLLVELRNPEQLERSLPRLAAAVGSLFLYRLEHHRHKNTDSFILQPLTPFSANAPVSFAFIDQFLALSSDPTTLQHLIDRSLGIPANSLADSETFQSLRSSFAPHAVAISYNNYLTLADVLKEIRLPRERSGSQSNAQGVYGFIEAFPTSRALKKYLDGKLAATIMSANAVHYKWRLWKN